MAADDMSDETQTQADVMVGLQGMMECNVTRHDMNLDPSMTMSSDRNKRL